MGFKIFPYTGGLYGHHLSAATINSTSTGSSVDYGDDWGKQFTLDDNTVTWIDRGATFLDLNVSLYQSAFKMGEVNFATASRQLARFGKVLTWAVDSPDGLKLLHRHKNRLQRIFLNLQVIPF
jgi:hypothetical protein